MAFDEHPHRDAAWLKPAVGHPGAPAGAEILSTALAGAYGFALTAQNPIGQIAYRWAMAAPTELPPALVVTAVEGIAELEGYVPSWATTIGADVVFATLTDEEGVANLRVKTSADTGSTIETTLDLADEALPGEVWAYRIQRASADLTLSATTLDTDVVVAVELAAISPDTGRGIPVYPLLVSVWWA